MQTVTAALIIIGNEILSGRTPDKNLAHIAVKLNENGVQMREVRVVADVTDEIVKAINEVRKKYDYIFTTGGIGPTHDDITADAVAKAFGVKLYRHPVAEEALRNHYEGTDSLNEARLKMADVPEGARLIPNHVTTAPGFAVENVYVMAGVPRIMQAMLDAIIPELKRGVSVLSSHITTDLTEGAIAKGLSEVQGRYSDVEIGSYPHFAHGELSTTLVFRSPDAKRNSAAELEVEKLIASLGGQLLNTPL